MAVNEPIRRVVGPNGDEAFEMWCGTNVSCCIVAIKENVPLLDDEELQPLKKLGIQLQVLRNPAVPSYVEGTSTLNSPEWELAFTESMRYKVQFEPVNAAICISHLRAIRQSLGTSHNWCIIIEEDAVPTPHFASGILSALLALSGIPTQANPVRTHPVREDPPAIIYFCMSLHVPWQQERVLNARNVWRASHHWAGPGQPCLKNLTPHPGRRSHWVGQGGHGYILSPDFAQFVLSKPIGNPWDLHLLDLLEQWYGRAYIIYPPPLVNVIHPAQSSKGSDRMRTYFGGEDEAATDYILLILDKAWGLWNRVRTIVWAAMLANFHRLGLFVLWQVSEFCDQKFEHVFPCFAAEARNICGGARWHLPFLNSTMAKVQL